MTREKEIHNIANTISTDIGKEIDEDYICNDIYDFTIGFECGAKWADKHPKRYNQEELCDIQLEMMKQRDARLIKKACEWLLHQEEMIGISFEDDFIERFKKVMEK